MGGDCDAAARYGGSEVRPAAGEGANEATSKGWLLQQLRDQLMGARTAEFWICRFSHLLWGCVELLVISESVRQLPQVRVAREPVNFSHAASGKHCALCFVVPYCVNMPYHCVS